MTEYLVTELPSKHIAGLSEAEDMAEELAAVSKTPYAVYVLLSEFHPTSAKDEQIVP